ncbi:uncharacterized protein LOC114828188 [Galendromus occidentalis]|uniref:Uncharacterized protein LOC114828188 n=1 Tax=Galendromus occidentalis TaxID=34638 RepID=A0AAJ7WH98_9ACAR|nr:uncharacterized protein LOC114828188 [Galendromus occidentalis]
MHQSKFFGACLLLTASAWAAEGPSTILPLLNPTTTTSTEAPPLPEPAALNSESLPIPEAHVSAQLQLGDSDGNNEHSGGPKVRKAAQSSDRDMTPSSTVPPTTLRVNDFNNQRDNRDRYYPDYRYPDYRGYDHRGYDDRGYYNRGYDPRGYPQPAGYGGGYGAPSRFYNDYDRYRGYDPYNNEPWRQRFHDPYYDRDPYYNRDGRSYGGRLPYSPYGNDYLNRIDPYRFGYSTDKLGRGFGYSCKDVFECQDLKNREEAQRDAQRRSYPPYPPVSSNYRAPYEHSNLWLPPTPSPSSGRSVTYFPHDRYSSYAPYAGGYGGYSPYYQGGYRNDYYRTKKK